MKKRIISLILCVVLAASLFVGCGSSKTETAAPTNEGSNAPAATAAPAAPAETQAPSFSTASASDFSSEDMEDELPF